MEHIQYGDYTKEQGIKVGYDWDGYEDGKTNEDLFGEILENLSGVRHITVANWEGAFECETSQAVLDWLVENSDKLTQVESLRIADMDWEECEISWIEHGSYSKLWAALPNLKHLTIQGATGLQLGDIASDKLETLEIISGGLNKNCIAEIKRATLPNLRKLNLYLGVDNYGFDGGPEDIQALLTESNFPKLEYLGICNSEIATDVVKAVLASKYAGQVTTLDISKSVFEDDSGEALLAGAGALTNLKLLDISYHYLSNEMMCKLSLNLPFALNANDPQGDDEEYKYPMFTE